MSSADQLVTMLLTTNNERSDGYRKPECRKKAFVPFRLHRIISLWKCRRNFLTRMHSRLILWSNVTFSMRRFVEAVSVFQFIFMCNAFLLQVDKYSWFVLLAVQSLDSLYKFFVFMYVIIFLSARRCVHIHWSFPWQTAPYKNDTTTKNKTK